MGKTNAKGEIGEAMILVDLQRDQRSVLLSAFTGWDGQVAASIRLTTTVNGSGEGVWLSASRPFTIGPSAGVAQW
ncbi:MAG: hypothetical protein ACRDX9_00645 [Acidimicrobiia bacterium]